MSDSKGKVAEFFQRVLEEAVPMFDRATVAFYGLRDERFVLNSTGVLLRIADAVFIITASHHLRKKVLNSVPLYVSWNERTDLPIPLHDAVFHSTEEGSRLGERDVVRDLAVIKLGDLTLAKSYLLAGNR